MSGGEFLLGAILVASGIFIGVYGDLLFRFVLAVIGFVIGLGGAYILLDGQDEAVRILVSLAAGGLAAGLLYGLVRFGLYIAGGVLGGIVGIIVASLIGQLDDGFGPVAIILAIAGIGGVGFFGPRLGAMIIPLATSAAAAFAIVGGITIWFETTYNTNSDDPTLALTHKSTLVLFAVFYALSFLAQYQIAILRNRVRN